MGVGGQHHAPAALYPWEKPGSHCIDGWVVPQGLSGWVRKISPPTGIPSPDRPANSELGFFSTRGTTLLPTISQQMQWNWRGKFLRLHYYKIKFLKRHFFTSTGLILCFVQYKTRNESIPNGQQLFYFIYK
jgi:hypothetical protein